MVFKELNEKKKRVAELKRKSNESEFKTKLYKIKNLENQLDSVSL